MIDIWLIKINVVEKKFRSTSVIKRSYKTEIIISDTLHLSNRNLVAFLNTIITCNTYMNNQKQVCYRFFLKSHLIYQATEKSVSVCVLCSDEQWDFLNRVHSTMHDLFTRKWDQNFNS